MSSVHNLLEDLIPTTTGSGYICVICENPLIISVETSCRHKFCSYCITLWKKYHPTCPICMYDIGSLTPRPDIDSLIETFFVTADQAMKTERVKAIAQRSAAVELVGVTAKDEMKALIEHLKPGTATTVAPLLPRVATATSDKKRDLTRLLRDTERFEQQLNIVYSKILTTGEKLTAREDVAVARLCSKVVDPEPGLNFGTVKADRPYTALPAGNFKPKRIGTAVVVPKSETVSKDQSEIDSLLELTDDVLRIDHLLKTFNFETLTEGGDEVEGDQDPGDISTDTSIQASTRTTTVQLHSSDHDTLVNFKVHPEVQKYLDKCPIKVKPLTPVVKKDSKVRPKTAAAPSPQLTAKSSLVDLTSKIIQCRESLLNLKSKAEVGPGSNPKVSFKPINYTGTYEAREDPVALVVNLIPPNSFDNPPNHSGDIVARRPLPSLRRPRILKPFKQEPEPVSSLPAIRDPKALPVIRVRPKTVVERKKASSTTFLPPRPR